MPYAFLDSTRHYGLSTDWRRKWDSGSSNVVAVATGGRDGGPSILLPGTPTTQATPEIVKTFPSTTQLCVGVRLRFAQFAHTNDYPERVLLEVRSFSAPLFRLAVREGRRLVAYRATKDVTTPDDPDTPENEEVSTLVWSANENMAPVSLLDSDQFYIACKISFLNDANGSYTVYLNGNLWLSGTGVFDAPGSKGRVNTLVIRGQHHDLNIGDVYIKYHDLEVEKNIQIDAFYPAISDGYYEDWVALINGLPSTDPNPERYTHINEEVVDDNQTTLQGDYVSQQQIDEEFTVTEKVTTKYEPVPIYTHTTAIVVVAQVIARRVHPLQPNKESYLNFKVGKPDGTLVTGASAQVPDEFYRYVPFIMELDPIVEDTWSLPVMNNYEFGFEVTP